MSDLLALINSVIPNSKKILPEYLSRFREIEVPRRAMLLKAGETAKNLYIVKHGCLRQYLLHEGKEITFQFFFENEAVASIESFRSGKPSDLNIESIEPSALLTLSKKDFNLMMKDIPELKEVFLELAMLRFEHYSKLFLSIITEPPKQRYLNLVQSDPRILQRVPQHYIASYLGITPVSLSRIRKKV